MKIDFKRLFNSLKNTIVIFIILAIVISIMAIICLPIFALLDMLFLWLMSLLGEIGMTILFIVIVICYVTISVYRNNN